MAMKIISTAPVDLLHFVQQFWGREKISLSPAGTDIQISIPVLIDNHVGSLGDLSRLVVYAKSPISLPSLSIGETKVYHRYRKPGCLCRAVAGVGTGKSGQLFHGNRQAGTGFSTGQHQPGESGKILPNESARHEDCGFS